jgi:hypothetical protein
VIPSPGANLVKLSWKRVFNRLCNKPFNMKVFRTTLIHTRLPHTRLPHTALSG